jgi:hypothetical protein
MTERPALRLVDTETGELKERPASVDEAMTLLSDLQQQIVMMDRELKGKRLRISQLEADKEAELMNAPERPVVEVIHACWKKATGRRRALHPTDYEQVGRCVKKFGLRKCLIAVAGAAYDPNHSPPRRNGSRERFDDLDLIFRSYAKMQSFIDRAPVGYEPKPEKVAAIAGVSVEWVTEQLRRKR